MMKNCPDCGVEPGAFHVEGCDVEQCATCGRQRLSCLCLDEPDPLPWTGEWPGTRELRDWCWYAYFRPGEGWIPCTPATPDAVPDYNRLHGPETEWNRELKRFTLKGETPI